jgi:hypothetical protein
MKTLSACLVMTLVALPIVGFADCELPSLVRAIPDGATASEQELLAVQTEIEAYVAAMDDYIACENEEMSVAGDTASADYLFMMSMRIASAREEVDKVAADFNEQVNAFRAARQANPNLR